MPRSYLILFRDIPQNAQNINLLSQRWHFLPPFQLFLSVPDHPFPAFLGGATLMPPKITFMMSRFMASLAGANDLCKEPWTDGPMDPLAIYPSGLVVEPYPSDHSQLGLWHSQYMEKYKMFQTTNQPFIDGFPSYKPLLIIIAVY